LLISTVFGIYFDKSETLKFKQSILPMRGVFSQKTLKEPPFGSGTFFESGINSTHFVFFLPSLHPKNSCRHPILDFLLSNSTVQKIPVNLFPTCPESHVVQRPSPLHIPFAPWRLCGKQYLSFSLLPFDFLFALYAKQKINQIDNSEMIDLQSNLHHPTLINASNSISFSNITLVLSPPTEINQTCFHFFETPQNSPKTTRFPHYFSFFLTFSQFFARFPHPIGVFVSKCAPKRTNPHVCVDFLSFTPQCERENPTQKRAKDHPWQAQNASGRILLAASRR